MPERPSVTLLRPGLELAWWVAKLGSQARPPVDPPGRMRPFMKAAKLPVRYLESIRQVVDDDGDFRSRVAALADEELLGRASWLWLARPDGWEEALAEAGAAASEADSEKGERTARRQLERAQAELVRVRAELAVLQRANEELSAGARQDAQARRKAESERDRLQTELQQARASGQERMAAENAALQAELAAAHDDALARRTELETDRAARTATFARADEAASALLAALGELRRLTDTAPPERPRNVELTSSRPTPRPAEKIEFDITGPRGTPRKGRARTPIALPPAIFDDSVEAAAFLVRRPGILLVVDGYNVTLGSWPDLELADQRQRLIDALAELTARAGPTVHVVFDGVDDGGWLRPPAVARGRLRVEFSPSEVEADELIIDVVQRLDPSRGVVVATNDRRVQDEVARRGANVIAVSQLLVVIGRGPQDR